MSLSWDWSPATFIFVLVVSFALATFTQKKWRGAWLLPAFVLYFGLDWELSSPWSWMFKLAFWLAVIVVLVTTILPAKTKLAKAPLALVSIVIVLGLLGSGWNWASNGDDVPVARPTTAAPTVTDTPVAEACADAFTQSLDPNKQYRFVSDGFKGTSNEKRQQLIEALGHDYRYLDFFAEQLFHKSIDETSLFNGDCLSADGQSLHAEVKGALMASGAKKGKASADSYNTGMEGGKAVVANDRGINGNRSATVYTLADGTELVVMDRCGNIALPSPPDNLPPGKTDNPKPPKKHTPKPKCVEIPGNGVADCNPKDPSKEPAQRGNVPDQVKGTNPPPKEEHKQPTKPADPPSTYKPPAAPKPSKPPKGSTPAPETPKPPKETGSDPGDGSGNTGDPGGF